MPSVAAYSKSSAAIYRSCKIFQPLEPANNPLKHAPQTAASLLGADWNLPYSREVRAFPVATLKGVKY